MELDDVLGNLLGAEHAVGCSIDARAHFVARGTLAWRVRREHEVNAHQAVVEDVAGEIEAPRHVVLNGLAQLIEAPDDLVRFVPLPDGGRLKRTPEAISELPQLVLGN